MSGAAHLHNSRRILKMTVRMTTTMRMTLMMLMILMMTTMRDGGRMLYDISQRKRTWLKLLFDKPSTTRFPNRRYRMKKHASPPEHLVSVCSRSHKTKISSILYQHLAAISIACYQALIHIHKYVYDSLLYLHPGMGRNARFPKTDKQFERPLHRSLPL
jgi:hypothetical protein